MNEADIDRLEMVLQGVLDFGDADLTEWERGFIADTRKRLDEYGPRIRMSEKQWAIIDRIWAKLPIR